MLPMVPRPTWPWSKPGIKPILHAAGGFVFALARTWKTVEEKTPGKSRDPCASQVLPMYPGSQRAWGGKAAEPRTYHTRLCLRHVGDVTLVLSRGRQRRPPQPETPGDPSGRVDTEPSRVALYQNAGD